MKEISAIIRMNKVNETKRALSEAGFPAITCRKVSGRGKKAVNFEIIQELLEGHDIQAPTLMESITEGHRLITKRMIMMVVLDSEVDSAVKAIIDANQTGNMGDGKIFICPISETIRIRTGETGDEAV
ncbi:MAG: P-II family nitrogen regulator [Firmicutes bacterium HGW-Firmicutes-7]|nr:MAG: P-II family nitrogen regulator [Firmicutes bacterium HGW-Firmicutes-7]